MKYLIVGLGNIGDDYADTRHNIGFTVLDALARSSDASFTDKRYGSVSQVRHKGRDLILLKPSTFMNLSGNAVRYWLNKEKIAVENMLIIVDDIALPLGSFRMRSKGGSGGHNGLTHVIETLGTDEYARIRVGIGNNFRKGSQVEYVLGTWNENEKKILGERIPVILDMIRSFVNAGTELTMTAFNRKGRFTTNEDKTGNPL
ncbi:MAG: aminoacyl-tRNA hydrolase [Bacteroidales bacterium]|nr:aminoacyl-tRNA hydrolase [Bacteroidales bacterium]